MGLQIQSRLVERGKGTRNHTLHSPQVLGSRKHRVGTWWDPVFHAALPLLSDTRPGTAPQPPATPGPFKSICTSFMLAAPGSIRLRCGLLLPRPAQQQSDVAAPISQRWVPNILLPQPEVVTPGRRLSREPRSSSISICP